MSKPLSCAAKHKKPVCDKCDAGTNCTKYCMCQGRIRGRPRKQNITVEHDSKPQRTNPTRQCAVRQIDIDPVIDDEILTVEQDEGTSYSSQAHILKVMELMGCPHEEHESSVRRLPPINIRREVLGLSEIPVASMQRIDNVFWRGIKAWAHMLLPNLRLKCDGDLKMSYKIWSAAEATEEQPPKAVPEVKEDPLVSVPSDILATIPNTIRDVLKREKRYTSIDARKLLVPLAHMPRADVASLLTISNKYAGRLLFQAKVDRLYLTHGVRLQEYHETHSRVPKDLISFAVGFIYSDENICRLAWEAKKTVSK